MSTTWTFNPGFYSDDEIVERFNIRLDALDALVSTSRSRTPTNQHTLVIGQRGFGKTMLLRRFAAELRRAPDLEAQWFPIVFSEESYPVASAGELWLEALTHLADASGDPRWQKAYTELRRERDEMRLRTRALAQLLDFADERGRDLVIIVENVDKLLGDLPESEGWALRETLLHERRIQLVAAASRRFEGVDDPSQPFYELFRRIQLDPLDDAQIATLWKGTNGEDLPTGRAIALRILTGGNPRLVVLLAALAKGLTLRELMNELAGLIDQHTNYFNANIEAITSNDMRRVFLALAEHWSPATAREVAEATRSDVNKTSTLLGRLVDQGRVEVVRDGKVRTYQVAERLYNIYYLMRRRGVHQARLAALVDFMALFLEPRQVSGLLVRFAGEPCDQDGERVLFDALVARFAMRGDPAVLTDFLRNVPRDYLALRAPTGLKRKMKSPHALVALLERPDGASFVDNAIAALVKLVPQTDVHESTKGSPKIVSDALALVRALIPVLPAGPSKRRDICGLVLLHLGESDESLRVCPPYPDGDALLLLQWFTSAMLAGRPDDATPLVGAFERGWSEMSRDMPPDSQLMGWAWVAECWVRALDFERALTVMRAHPNVVVFNRVHDAARILDSRHRLRLARRWTEVLPDQTVGWVFRWTSEKDPSERDAVLDHLAASGDALGRLVAALGYASQGRPLEALRLLPTILGEPADVSSDDIILSPALLSLARAVPAKDLVAILRGTPAAARLEPIFVALQRRAGEAVDAPREVLELADLVDQRIDEGDPFASLAQAEEAPTPNPSARPRRRKA